MPEIEVYIESRDLSVNRRMFQYADLEVEAILNDARTCKFNCPITDTNALNQSNVQHFLPLRRFVKVLYRGRPIFWGPITKPSFNFKENRVEVQCVDPSIWMMNHHIDTKEAEDNDELRVNGEGVEDLVFATYLTPAEFAAGFAEFPVTLGVGEAYFINPPESGAGERRTHKVENGVSVWDALGELAEAIDGPDWMFLPIDKGYDPYAAWAPGFGVSLVAKQTLGEDRRDEVIFHFGHGRTNLENFIYEPDGTTVRNRYVVSNGRGIYKVAKYPDGMQSMGIMEGWEQAPGRAGGRARGMEEKARLMVESYGEPIPTFTIEPTWDQGLIGSEASVPWRFPTGYDLGDYITAVAKLDRMVVSQVGRVTKVTLTQLNAAENVKAQIECVPVPVDVDEDVSVGDTIQ